MTDAEYRECIEFLRSAQETPGSVRRVMDGAQLKSWMALHRWENAALAAELGVRKQELSRWRNDRVPIRASVVLALQTLEREAGRT
jgi:hypothetical protein